MSCHFHFHVKGVELVEETSRLQPSWDESISSVGAGTHLVAGHGPYLSNACNGLQPRSHRAMLEAYRSLLAKRNVASKWHDLLAEDQSTCQLVGRKHGTPIETTALSNLGFRV